VKLFLSVVALIALAVNARAQPSNLSAAASSTNSASVLTTNATANTNELLEAELRVIMLKDEMAQAEVDKWIRDNQAFAEKGAGMPPKELNQKILKRFEPVRAAYEDFIKRNPRHVEARLAYASFLSDVHDEEAEKEQLLAAKEIDPSRPSIWNNLANYYGHNGEVRTAFTHYEKAIELDPNESVYYHNFGTTVYLFRRDVEAHYSINEQQVFDKALALYSNSMRLDPANFSLATDVAQSYYGIKPTRVEDALVAWTNAMNIAKTDLEKQSVHIHLARVKLFADRFDQSRAHMSHVNDPMLEELRTRLVKNLDLQEARARGTNASSATTTNALPAK
jgi:tetratricopeptide (TPR) repeat protein